MTSPPEFDTGLRPTELDPERPRPVETPWGTMALYVIDGDVLCSQAFCPHLEGPLFQGTVSNEPVSPESGCEPGAGARRHTICCPWHHWRYDLASGERVEPPLGEEPPDEPLVRCRVGASAAGTVLLFRPGS